MIIVLRTGATDAEIGEVMSELERRRLTGRVVHADGKSVVHVAGGSTRQTRKLVRLAQVEALIPTSGPRVRREGRRFYPYHFVNWSAVGVASLGVLVFLAGLFPPGIGDAVDYRHPLATVANPWFARTPFVLVALGFLVLLALPLIDRSPAEKFRTVRVLVGFALALFAIYVCVQGAMA
jgi:hypothetical protein